MKELERLLVWIVPLAILQALGHALVAGGFRHVLASDGLLGLSPAETLSVLTTGGMALGLLVNLAVALWLLKAARKVGGSRALWSLFGATFGVLALVVFLLARLYEAQRATG
ncbi:hypothetical protein HUS23_08145 [Ectothiorhodospiraceae bacterium 2226]|nr:hypothetical protein HUS23_08145 [Ectothiorhodospiraceae bacterium 2226]